MPVGSIGLAIGDGVRGAGILMNRYLLSVRAFLVRGETGVFVHVHVSVFSRKYCKQRY